MDSKSQVEVAFDKQLDIIIFNDFKWVFNIHFDTDDSDEMFFWKTSCNIVDKVTEKYPQYYD